MPLSNIPDEFEQEIKQDLQEIQDSLKPPSMEYGAFNFIPNSEKVFMYVHPSSTQLIKVLLGRNKTVG